MVARARRNGTSQGEDRVTVEISYGRSLARAALFFSLSRGGRPVRVHALSTTVLFPRTADEGRIAKGIPLPVPSICHRGEAELIRIRMPDTYLNVRAYINLFKMHE